MSVTYKDIAIEALGELQMYQAGDLPAPEDVTFAMSKLVRLIDNLNADRGFSYTETFVTYVLVPNLSPHTIGPTGATWTTAIRPESIEGANLILPSGSTPINTPINIRDYQWWLAQSTQQQTITYPTDLYYEPGWPNGNLYFWPVPTVAYSVQLAIRTLFSESFTQATSFSLPPGYRDMITLTLAEDLISAYGSAAQPSPMLPMKAREARQRVFGANTFVPKLVTQDSGMPSGSSRTMTSFNYLSRTWNP